MRPWGRYISFPPAEDLTAYIYTVPRLGWPNCCCMAGALTPSCWRWLPWPAQGSLLDARRTPPPSTTPRPGPRQDHRSEELESALSECSYHVRYVRLPSTLKIKMGSSKKLGNIINLFTGGGAAGRAAGPGTVCF